MKTAQADPAERMRTLLQNPKCQRAYSMNIEAAQLKSINAYNEKIENGATKDQAKAFAVQVRDEAIITFLEAAQ